MIKEPISHHASKTKALDAEVRRAFARNLRTMREKNGLTQGQLGKLASISRSRICEIEMGPSKNVTLETARRLATALGIKLQDLIS